MPRYIDVENYCENVCRCYAPHCDKSKCPIFNAPPADVALVVHGKWVRISTTLHKEDIEVEEKCSCCGRRVARYTTHQQDNYCPSCGAKMDGGDTP